MSVRDKLLVKSTIADNGTVVGHISAYTQVVVNILTSVHSTFDTGSTYPKILTSLS